jgi:CIC family chloride channel protein
MIVSSISYAISRRFERHSMDVKQLARKGHAFTNNKDKNILSNLETEKIIQTDYLTLMPEDNLMRLVDLISHSNQVIFAVVNDHQELLGIVHFNDVREIIFSNFKVKYTPVSEVMIPALDVVYPTDSMEAVMNKFEKCKVNYLPVLKNSKYYGFISKAHALEAYREKLKAMIIE